MEMDKAFCPYSAFILSAFARVFWKRIDMDETEQYHRKSWGGSVASSSSKTNVNNDKPNLLHLYNIIPPGHRNNLVPVS